MKIIDRQIVSAHIYSSDGKLFIARNNSLVAGGVYGDCWKIPGGGVDPGENNLQALVREIKEEINIDIDHLTIELIDDSITGEAEKNLRQTGERVLAKMKFFAYKVVLDKPASDILVTLDPHEFNEYKWVEISNLESFKFSPPSIELFKKLGYWE